MYDHSFLSWSTSLAITFGTILSGYSSAQSESPLADGFYQVVENGTGVEVARTYGGTVRLVEQRSSEFGDVSIWSVTNDNSRWRVRCQYVPAFDCIVPIGLYCDGVCDMVWSHSDPDDANTIELDADVWGQENAERLATKLDCEPQSRSHPGHKMLCRWKPLHKSFEPGEPVMLELQIENVGEEPLRFIAGGQQRGARDNQFRFIARAGSGYGDAVPDTGDATNFGGLGGYIDLKPGEVFRKKIDITKWFDFKHPDTYRITGLYELAIYDEGFHRVIWDDFAVGECTVRIDVARETPGGAD